MHAWAGTSTVAKVSMVLSKHWRSIACKIDLICRNPPPFAVDETISKQLSTERQISRKTKSCGRRTEICACNGLDNRKAEKDSALCLCPTVVYRKGFPPHFTLTRKQISILNAL